MIARIMVIVIVTGLASVSRSAVEEPAGPMRNCTEGECHAKERGYRIMHGPTGLGACDVCHKAADERRHTFTLQARDKALCDFCHVEKQAAARVVHKPVAEGQCLSCHNPHGSNVKAMLRRDDMAALCRDCHQDVTQQRKHVHGPVASGSCAACHNGHRSDFPKLLVGQGRDMCLGCHEQMRGQLATVKTLHKPMEGDCLQCHEAHASNQIMQLRQGPLDLCSSCHPNVQEMATTSKHRHEPVIAGNACINCHTPHGGDLAKLMKSDTISACLQCHDKQVKTPDGRVVAAVPEVARKQLFQHGPIRDGECSGCHLLHGSDHSRLLARPYTQAFYEPFELSHYELCFQCHDPQMVLAEKTRGLTNFRNGEVNLHYLHVNNKDKGRTCRACHSTHASDKPLHVRETVPYGKWEMPVAFKKTDTGGSCASGCHKEYAYDRERPVPMTTTTAKAGK